MDRQEFLSQFDEILDMNDANFATQLADALGLKLGCNVEISTPQFNRTDGKQITYLPSTPEEYEAIKELSKENLLKIGCGIWDETETSTHFLYPVEWYEHIPNGTEITSISGETETFTRGATDDDCRFGMLAYGFIKPRSE